jgi:UDP-2,3-diacylglucosamine hydrolase
MKPRFISDLHLSDKHPELTQAFFKFLDESKEACTHLFILGDLFETWIGDDDDLPLYQDIKDKLLHFTTGGPKTFFLHGNRDFLVGESFAKETGITILPDPYALEINGKKVILSHGDFLCTDDKDYLDFRKQVREKDWQANFLKKSLNERKQIAANLRKDSKEASAKKSNSITDVNDLAVKEFINERQPDLLIHGHTHRPDIHKIGSSKRVVLGDWGNYGWLLTINDQDFNLEKFSIA